MKALLLDRDGVVNVDHGYVCEVEQFTFVDGIFALTRRAVDLGYRVAVVTNQSGIARGYYPVSQFLELSRWMAAEFEQRGVTLAGVFHCPYHKAGTLRPYNRESFWRKPNPGMILEAQQRLGLDLGRSLFLGDQPSDMAAARAAGVGRRVLLTHGRPVACANADQAIATLSEAEALL
ncbi:D-glycero-beta-D-manno-heptose 1,7-bisphosphate 7-phosphatase [Azospirillum sp.]|uniref:HAD family hydrolase n=1 Tax=Azospirillum sp. TaxID=34012 RepID=UPI003D74BD3A